MSIEEGGAAFPGPFSGHCGKPDHMATCDCYVDKGMTLRDWFAGQAIVGVKFSVSQNEDAVAKAAYRRADAMIKARTAQ